MKKLLKFFKDFSIYFYILIFSYILTISVYNNDPFRRQVKVNIKTKTPIGLSLKYSDKNNNNYEKIKVIKDKKTIFLPNKINLKITLLNIEDEKQKNDILLKIEKSNISLNTSNKILYQSDKLIRGSRHIEKIFPFFVYFFIINVFLIFANNFTPKIRDTKIISNVNFLRVFFAIIVSLSHYSAVLTPGHNLLATNVWFAECFIIISGFILFFTANFKDTDFKAYFSKRFIRLFPSFFVVICLLFPFVSDIYHFTSGQYHFVQTKFYILTKLSTLSLLMPKYYNADFLWAIPFFFWANCLLFAIVKYFKEKSNFILAVLMCLFLYLYFANNNAILFNRYYILLVCIFAGYFIALISKEYVLTDNKLIINFLELYISLFLVISLFYNYSEIFPHFAVLYYMHTLGLVYLFYQKKGFISNFFERKIFDKIAKYSFSYYLIHELIYIIFLKYKILLNADNKVRVLVAVFTSMVAAFLLYHLVEKPIADRFKAKK